MIFLFVIMDRSERAKINKLLKSVKPEKVDAVRGMIKNASFDDAMTVINAFTGQNKPVLVDKGIEEPEKVNKPLNEPLERVNGDLCPDSYSIEDIKIRIQETINHFLLINDIEDMTKAPQRQFNALASYVGQNVFKGTNLLKLSGMKNNEYDINKIVEVLNVFVDYCLIYNKAFTLDAGAYFCGVNDNYLTDNKEKLTRAGFDPLKKSESTISASILDNRQCVGSIAYLNHVFNWQTASTHTEKKETVVIYPMLSGDIKSNNLITSTENN